MESAITSLATAPHPFVDELKTIPIFADLCNEGLEWLASHMQVLDLMPGDLAIHAGASAEHLIVILAGELRAERNGGGVYVAQAGQVTGLLPFSRLTQYPNNIKAVTRLRVAALHKDLFAEMMERMPALQQKLVNVMADRIREATAADLQRSKLTALGKLSAGLAHELNNPASAAQRAASNLRSALNSVRRAALKLDKEGLPLESRVFLAQLECEWAEQAGPQTALDSLDRSEKEEELAQWLNQHGIEKPWDLAAALVDLGCTKETLVRIESNVPERFLNDVFVRVTAAFTISRLADEIESSSARISELVRAVKEYSYMDQMPEQDIDIHNGLENTLIMLRHKLKKGVDVVREYDRALPKVCARGSELNQIWTNLIVNSIEAMEYHGKLVIRTSRDERCARVEIIDNGPGIPQDIKDRIFEPFFTTKAVGDGTGLGLDTVFRIARSHSGDVTFESRPGETRFTVRIPFSSAALAS
jgi:signal transduction histidine kinase